MSTNNAKDNVNASTHLANLLQHFRENHSMQILQVGIDSWEYLSGGRGELAVVIIPGCGGTAESMFTVHAALESNVRVISLGIPATVSTTEQVVAGIRGVLDSTGLRRTVFLGHSLGGIVAQAFAFRHPARVAGLVLSNTGFYLGMRAILLPRAMKLMALVPQPLLLRTVASQMNRLLASSEASNFWRRFYQEELRVPEAGKRLRQQGVLMSDLLRFFRSYPILPSLAWAQSMPVQIISSVDDKGFTPREIAFLGSLYPRSQTATFPAETGHLSFLTRPAAYVAAVQQLIRRVEES